MAEFDEDLTQAEERFLGLQTSLSGLEGVTSAFRRELDEIQGSMKAAGREATGMSSSVTSSIRKAFDGVIFDGEKLSDALASVGRSLSSSVLNSAFQPLQGAVNSAVSGGLSSLLSGFLPFANGGAFSGGRPAAFARGGVVDGPTHFPMRGGLGLMGEAGPEAIMPLARGSDGKLGVRGAGSAGGSVHVTMNISTPDATGFQRSQTQIAAEMSRAIQRGRRNL